MGDESEVTITVIPYFVIVGGGTYPDPCWDVDERVFF
jgi:hypothetical protein|tara:strand:+ start:401 stop:511 length:111 start_codon:yes stop_codon:yes gene_type:complete